MSATVTVLGQRRTLAEMDATIGGIERTRREGRARVVASGIDPAPLAELERVTEQYLEVLRQGRAILARGMPGDG